MIDEEGGISEVIQTDVTNEDSCKAAVAKTVELFGAVHILVNIGKVMLVSAKAFALPIFQGLLIMLCRHSGCRRRHWRCHGAEP
jgi:NAD(P)-dependent dehydrogenase (short-subunit alcohol dehydrogenase family)